MMGGYERRAARIDSYTNDYMNTIQHIRLIYHRKRD
jgi:hypothetical protein